MMIKDIVRIFKRYVDYKRTLKDLEDKIKLNSKGYIDKEDSWATLYKETHEEYTRWMNTPLSEL